MRSLIISDAGFIGCHAARHRLALGHEVLVLHEPESAPELCLSRSRLFQLS